MHERAVRSLGIARWGSGRFMGSARGRLPPAAALCLSTACSGASADPAAPTARAVDPRLSIAQRAPQAVEGIDVFDGQGAIDWNAVADAGVAFAWIKATQGTYDTQATFADNWSQAKSAGIARGAYHFFDPREDGAAQAQHFIAVVGSLEPDDFPAMLDVECPDGATDCVLAGISGRTPAADIAVRIRAFLQGVKASTAKTPVIYTYKTYFASTGVDATGLEAYPLFLAYPAADKCIDVPAPWSKATLWQYTWTGAVAGVSGAVDRDRFLGTRADLNALAQSTKETTEDAAPAPAPAPASASPRRDAPRPTFRD
jgi:lysozyme